jgi:hypothetical protein
MESQSPALVFLLGVVACSSSPSHGPSGDAPVDDAVGLVGAAEFGGGSSASAETPSGETALATRYRIPDAPFRQAPCGADGAGNVLASEILLGQTHLLPVDHPFQSIVEGRPLTLAIAAQGHGPAPAFSATARLSDKSLSVCLDGPATLPATAGDLESTYRVTLPASWVHPGLKLELTSGATSQTLSPHIVAESGTTLYLINTELFGQGSSTPTSDDRLREFLSRLPFSWLDVSQNPFGIWRPAKLLIEARTDGLSPDGSRTNVAYGPIVVSGYPHCTADDKAAQRCSVHFRRANGAEKTSTWYAHLAMGLGGGLGGGQRAVGDNDELVMNHELGHAWGFPHWGTANVEYPYVGEQAGSGGFGDSSAVDQRTGQLMSPACDGLERQSPMQRRGNPCVPDAAVFDPYSDYESIRLLRMLTGATTKTAGRVPYHHSQAQSSSFELPSEAGRLQQTHTVDAPGFSLLRYDETRNAWLPSQDTAWNRVEVAEVEVVMFSGAAIYDGDSYFDAPMSYIGNVTRSIDPSSVTGWAELYAGRGGAFYWAHDTTFRLWLDDGSQVVQLASSAGKSLRQAGDTVWFAVNVPKAIAAHVVKLEVLSRPLGQYAPDSQIAQDFEPSKFLDSAKVVATWHR